MSLETFDSNCVELINYIGNKCSEAEILVNGVFALCFIILFSGYMDDNVKEYNKSVLNVFKHINKTNGFIVPFLFFVFNCLKKFSLFPLFRKALGAIFGEEWLKSNYIIPEMWVILNLVLALIGKWLITFSGNIIVAYLFLFTSSFRIFAMLIYQINVLFFDRYEQWYLYPPKDTCEDVYKIQSGTRIIVLLLINMFEYIIHFSVIYVAINCIAGNAVGVLSIVDSFELFFNMKDVSIFKEKGLLLYAYSEICIGMFMNVLCIARMLNLLPNVNTVTK